MTYARLDYVHIYETIVTAWTYSQSQMESTGSLFLCAYPSLLLNTSIAITSTTSLFQTCTAPHQVDYISSNMQSAEPWWGLFTCHLNIKHVLFTVMPRRSTSYSKLGTLSMKIWANSQINDISFPEVCIIWRTIWKNKVFFHVSIDINPLKQHLK